MQKNNSLLIGWIAALSGLFSPILVDVPFKYYAEIAFAPGVLFLILYFLSFRYRKVAGLFRPETLFMWLFMMSMTAMSLAYPRTMEIPELRLVSRIIYYTFILVYLYIFLAAESAFLRIDWPVLTLFIFGSFFNLSLSAAAAFPVFYYIIAFVTFRISKEKNTAGNSEKVLLIAALLLIFVTFISTDPLRAAGFFLRWYSGMLLLYYIAAFSNRNYISRVLVLVSLGYFIYFFSGIFFQMGADPLYNPFAHKKAYISGVNTNDMGAISLLIFGFSFSILLQSIHDNKYKMILSLMFFLTSVSLVTVSHSRTAYPVPFVLIGLWIYILIYKKIKNKWYLPAAVIILIITGGAWISVFYLDLFRTVIWNDLTMVTRRIQWSYAWEAVKDRPFTGWGGDNSLPLLTYPLSIISENSIPVNSQIISVMTVSHAHNTVLEILMETGVIFALPVLGIILLILWKTWKAAASENTAYFIGPAGSVTMFLIHGIANYSLFLVPVFLLFSVMLGLGLNNNIKENAPDFQRSGKRFIDIVNIIVIIFSAYMLISISLFKTSEQRLKPVLYWNHFQERILIPGKTAAKSSEDRDLDFSLKFAELHSLMHPVSTPALRLTGDIYSLKYARYRKPEYFKAAVRSYKKILRGKENHSYAFHKLADLYSLYMPEKSGTILFYRQFAQVTDPFRLLERGSIKIYQ